MEGEKAKEFLNFQHRRKVIGLCKAYLVLIEDIKNENGCIDDKQYTKIRKKVLDAGNDVVREMEEYTGKLNINF
jgi:hypothetical protein